MISPSTSTPEFHFFHSPRELQLRITKSTTMDGFNMAIHVAGQVKDFKIIMSPHDLADLNKHLQGVLQRVVHSSPDLESVAPELGQEQLLELAEAGWGAFRAIFPDPAAQSLVRDLLPQMSSARVEVTSESFYVPWELIYPHRPDLDLSFQHFWGFRHTISRTIPRHYSGIIPPEIRTSRPRVGLLLYNALQAAIEVELPYFEKLDAGGVIKLERLPALDPEQHPQGMEEVVRFFSQDLDIVHFGCHAMVTVEDPAGSHLMVATEFPLSMRKLKTQVEKIAGSPLVILNACNTGILNPLYTVHFTSALLLQGARGVVATDCAVPDQLAAAFAQRLHDSLVRGRPLGQSLLQARKAFLRELRNPFGLLYSMYAYPDIRIIPGRRSL